MYPNLTLEDLYVFSDIERMHKEIGGMISTYPQAHALTLESACEYILFLLLLIVLRWLQSKYPENKVEFLICHRICQGRIETDKVLKLHSSILISNE
jgi:hypothetical protein